MAEYIEREKFRKFAMEMTDSNEIKFECCYPYWQFNKAIAEMTAADVAPIRHGRWILVDKSYGEYECSVCHARDSNCSDYYGAHNVTDQDYCPHCGAKMD